MDQKKRTNRISMAFAKNMKSFLSDDEAEDLPMEEEAPRTSIDLEKIRMMVKKIFVTSRFGTVYDAALLILSFLSCIQLIYQTYLDAEDESDMKIRESFEILEMVLAVLFGFDWLLSLFLADVKSEFFMSFFSMVDLLTVIPVWFTSREELQYYHPGMTSWEMYIYSLNALATFRVCRVFRVRRFLDKVENEVEKMVGEILLTLFVGLVFFAAIIQFLERHEEHALNPHRWHNWFYFAMITFTTVGFGDLYPVSALGQGTCMIFIAIATILLPKMINDLSEKIRATSPYARAVFKKKGTKHAHVIICGDLSTCHLEELFGELFHEDHAGDMALTAVVLQPEPPTKAMFQILNDPIFAMCIDYLEGSALSQADLQRSRAHEALAVFIFANKYTPSADEEDAKVILQQLSISKYVAHHDSDSPVFCLQIGRPENRRHLTKKNKAKVDSGTQTHDDLVVCINELKMGILAKSVVFPGMSVLLFNLLSSFSEEEEDEVDEEEGEHGVEEKAATTSWLEEYQLGCDWEIYSTNLSKYFEGAPFSQLAKMLYLRLQIVLIGLKVRPRNGKGGGTPRLLLNPGDWPIPSNEEYEVHGFVIAKNKMDSDLSKVFQGSGGRHQNEQSLARMSKLNLVANTMISGVTMLGESGRNRISMLRNSEVRSDSGAKTNDAMVNAVNRAKLKYIRSNKAGSNQEVTERPTELGWKAFLSSELQQRDRSNQEKELQEHEENLRRNYYIRDKPADLDVCLISGYVTTEVPSVDDHIIIACRGFEYLYDLVLPLRSKQAGHCRYIVILSTAEMTASVWRKISRFEGILVVRGSSLVEADLRRAGIYRCKQMVVLTDGGSSGDAGGQTQRKLMDRQLVDVDAIFTYKLVKRLSDRTSIILEVVREENIVYMDPDQTQQLSFKYKFSPQFAAGRLFTPSVIDTLLIQSYYNRDLINLMNAMLGLDMKDGSESNTKPAVARSGVSKRTLSEVRSSSLHQLGIPDGLGTMTYGAMFEHFSKHEVLPIGLLRGVSHVNKARGNRLEYVVANPMADTELENTDKVFVLCSAATYSRLMHSTRTRNSNGLQEMHRQERIRENRNHNMSVKDMADGIAKLKLRHKVLTSKISSIHDATLRGLTSQVEIARLRKQLDSETGLQPSDAALKAAASAF